MKLLAVITMLIGIFSLSVHAKELRFDNYLNAPYSEVRAGLISQGWKTITNKKIQDSSLYAQDIFNQGYEEVLDCISMERDQCKFVFKKNKQLILVTTKDKTLNVESIEIKK